MTDATTITLGGREFDLSKKFTIRGLKEIAAAMEAPGDTLVQVIERGANILFVAIRHFDATLSEDNILAMTTDAHALSDAVSTVLQVAGFRNTPLDAPPAAPTMPSQTSADAPADPAQSDAGATAEAMIAAA